MKVIRPKNKKWNRVYDVVTEAEIGSSKEVFREWQAVNVSSVYMLSDMHINQ